MIGRTNAGGCGGLNKSVIIVTAPTGSTVTCKSGTTTKTAAEKNGTWTFTGLDNGTWTVTATKDSNTATKSVTISRLTVEYVTIAYNQIPAFTYTGDYEIVDDDDNPITISQGDWKIRFLTSGTLKFTELRGAENGIDVFAVGGGGSGKTKISSGRWYGGGGGSGYTGTKKAVKVTTNTSYGITVGAGAAAVTGIEEKAGGNTVAFGLTVKGGNDSFPNVTAVDSRGGNGGSGGASGYLATTAVASNAGGTNGGNGGAASTEMETAGVGQGTTTREFGESTGKLYATGGDGGAASPKSGAVNTGNGGDGARGATSGAGGSGIVIIRNKR